MKKAVVALARQLYMIMHRIWVESGTEPSSDGPGNKPQRMTAQIKRNRRTLEERRAVE